MQEAQDKILQDTRKTQGIARNQKETDTALNYRNYLLASGSESEIDDFVKNNPVLMV